MICLKYGLLFTVAVVTVVSATAPPKKDTLPVKYDNYGTDRGPKRVGDLGKNPEDVLYVKGQPVDADKADEAEDGAYAGDKVKEVKAEENLELAGKYAEGKKLSHGKDRVYSKSEIKEVKYPEEKTDGYAEVKEVSKFEKGGADYLGKSGGYGPSGPVRKVIKEERLIKQEGSAAGDFGEGKDEHFELNEGDQLNDGGHLHGWAGGYLIPDDSKLVGTYGPDEPVAAGPKDSDGYGKPEGDKHFGGEHKFGNKESTYKFEDKRGKDEYDAPKDGYAEGKKIYKETTKEVKTEYGTGYGGDKKVEEYGGKFEEKKFGDGKYGGDKFEEKKFGDDKYGGKFEGKKFEDDKYEDKFEEKKFESDKKLGDDKYGGKFEDKKFEEKKFEDDKYGGKFEEKKYESEKKFGDEKYGGKFEEKFGNEKYDGKFEEKKYGGEKKFEDEKYGSKFEEKKYEEKKFEDDKYGGKFEEKKYDSEKKFGDDKYGSKFEEKKFEDEKFGGEKYEGKFEKKFEDQKYGGDKFEDEKKKFGGGDYEAKPGVYGEDKIIQKTKVIKTGYGDYEGAKPGGSVTTLSTPACNKLVDGLFDKLQRTFTGHMTSIKMDQFPPVSIGGWARVRLTEGKVDHIGKMCRGGDFQVLPQGETVIIRGTLKVPEPKAKFCGDAYLYNRLKVRNRNLLMCASDASFRVQMIVNKKMKKIDVDELEPVAVHGFHLEDEKGVRSESLAWPFNKIRENHLNKQKYQLMSTLRRKLCDDFRQVVAKPEVKEEILSIV